MIVAFAWNSLAGKLDKLNEDVSKSFSQSTQRLGLKLEGKMTVLHTIIYCHGQAIDVTTNCADYPDEAACVRAFNQAIDAVLEGCDGLQAIFEKHKYTPKDHAGADPAKPR